MPVEMSLIGLKQTCKINQNRENKHPQAPNNRESQSQISAPSASALSKMVKNEHNQGGTTHSGAPCGHPDPHGYLC